MKYLMPMLNPGVMGAMSPLVQLIELFKKPQMTSDTGDPNAGLNNLAARSFGQSR
jgi:hypothetical protein